jgi:hypothetical protein
VQVRFLCTRDVHVKVTVVAVADGARTTRITRDIAVRDKTPTTCRASANG